MKKIFEHLDSLEIYLMFNCGGVLKSKKTRANTQHLSLTVGQNFSKRNQETCKLTEKRDTLTN